METYELPELKNLISVTGQIDLYPGVAQVCVCGGGGGGGGGGGECCRGGGPDTYRSGRTDLMFRLVTK